MTFTEHRHTNGVAFTTAPVIAARHAFTTRIGGVSTGYLAGLNLSATHDAPENVKENFRLLGEATGIDVNRMAFTKQVHGSAVRTASFADVHTLCTDVPYEADGLVTAERGLALICFAADCIPVLLCDEKNGVIAAVHCGWRSSVADILGEAAGKMRALGASPESTAAAIGPAISYCCFEVGEEVVAAAEKLLGGDLSGLCRAEEGKAGKYRLDLKGVNRRRLLQLGLREENIAVSDECTMCLPERYWSHRATGGKRGLQGALIVLD